MEPGFQDPGEVEEANTFVVSLADALTCVFGAAIALFLIFLVLVKLDPVEATADTTSAASLRNAQLSDFEQQRLQDFSVIVVVTAPTCAPLEGFFVNRDVVLGLETWLAAPGLSGSGARSRCQLFLRFPAGLNTPVTLRTSRVGSNMAVRVLVGPVFTEPHRFTVNAWRGSNARPVVTISPDGDLRFEGNL